MPRFKIPVTWSVTGIHDVIAGNLENAMDKAAKLPLPEGTYISDSVAVDEDEAYYMNEDIVIKQEERAGYKEDYQFDQQETEALDKSYEEAKRASEERSA